MQSVLIRCHIQTLAIGAITSLAVVSSVARLSVKEASARLGICQCHWQSVVLNGHPSVGGSSCRREGHDPHYKRRPLSTPNRLSARRRMCNEGNPRPTPHITAHVIESEPCWGDEPTGAVRYPPHCYRIDYNWRCSFRSRHPIEK